MPEEDLELSEDGWVVTSSETEEVFVMVLNGEEEEPLVGSPEEIWEA